MAQKTYHNLKALKTKELLWLDLSTRTQWKIPPLAPTAKKHIPHKALLLITNILHLCSVECESLRLHELYPTRLLTPLSMEFSRQEYWSGLPLPSPGDLSNLVIKFASLVSYIGRWILSHGATWEVPSNSAIVHLIRLFGGCYWEQRPFPKLLPIIKEFKSLRRLEQKQVICQEPIQSLETLVSQSQSKPAPWLWFTYTEFSCFSMIFHNKIYHLVKLWHSVF